MVPMVTDAPTEAGPSLHRPGENSSSSIPSLEAAFKDRRRQRLLRGIQRISSASSLPQAGRFRSSSAPYGTRSNLSCVSLSPADSSAPTSSGSLTPGYFSASRSPFLSTARPSSATSENDEVLLAPRRTDKVSPAALTPSTSCLPTDVTLSRPGFGTKPRPRSKNLGDFWASMPTEIQVQILSHLKTKELVCLSRVNRQFYKLCFDGQLWTCFDASEFYTEIPAESLAKIIASAGPFIQNLNLRGCLQIEHFKRAEVLVKACKNIVNISLEGCRNFERATLHDLIRSNHRLANLNFTSMTAVNNSTCKIISQNCPQLTSLNVSWCKHMDARGIKMMVLGCPKLRELRASEVRGFDSIDVAKAIFKTNGLERLVLSGCTDLTDDAIKTMVHGVQPEIDILTDRPIVPVRKLRHLDLSRCSHLTDRGVKALGHLVPDLEGLQLNGCAELTDMALEPIIASTPNLTHLELEDLFEITDGILAKHLAHAPCATKLQHLSVSNCENVGSVGMLPIMKNCVGLQSVDMDNTRICDLVLAEAASMVRSRAALTSVRGSCPRVGLKLVAFDCNAVTWRGIRDVLTWNANGRRNSSYTPAYPTETVALKCSHIWQQTVDQHTLRVLRGDFAGAMRLEQKWADYMQAVEEVGVDGVGLRRRRRRAREARLLHATEEQGVFGVFGRRRAHTMAASCAIM